MLLKRIAGVCFALAFLMAVVLFGGYGRQYISISTAKMIFLGAGALGLLLNLVSFQSGKHSPFFSFIYWAGSIILFTGLTFILMRWPYGFYIVVTGLVVLGLSFVLPESLVNAKEKDPNILDDVD